MPQTTVYKGKVDLLQILDEDGKLDCSLAKDTLTDADVKVLYEKMIICRQYDEAAFKLQRSGRMGTWVPNKGQEAATLGAARALRKGFDFIVPYYREAPALYLHGLPLHYLLLHWMGDERGNAIPASLCMTPPCVAIGMHLLHAAGIAWAFKLRKEQRVAMCFFGDGATSTGDFHEGMNFASVFKVPAVYSCVNNQWAISTPCSKQTAAQTMAQKALAYNMPTIQVDGNDIFAVYKAHRDAVERARAGEGPQFVEEVTYRLGDHTTSDDARRYRPTEEYDVALKRDPIFRTRKYLESVGVWNDQEQAQAEKRAATIVQEVCRTALDMEPAPATDIFDFTYLELPDELIRQRNTRRTSSIGQNPQQAGLKQPAIEDVMPAPHTSST